MLINVNCFVVIFFVTVLNGRFSNGILEMHKKPCGWGSTSSAEGKVQNISYSFKITMKLFALMKELYEKHRDEVANITPAGCVRDEKTGKLYVVTSLPTTSATTSETTSEPTSEEYYFEELKWPELCTLVACIGWEVNLIDNQIRNDPNFEMYKYEKAATLIAILFNQFLAFFAASNILLESVNDKPVTHEFVRNKAIIACYLIRFAKMLKTETIVKVLLKVFKDLDETVIILFTNIRTALERLDDKIGSLGNLAILSQKFYHPEQETVFAVDREPAIEHYLLTTLGNMLYNHETIKGDDEFIYRERISVYVRFMKKYRYYGRRILEKPSERPEVTFVVDMLRDVEVLWGMYYQYFANVKDASFLIIQNVENTSLILEPVKKTDDPKNVKKLVVLKLIQKEGSAPAVQQIIAQ